MKKIDVLQWGVKHIATNHNFDFVNDDDGDHTFTIYGTIVPTLCDVKMMCEDLGISRKDIYYNSFFGIDIMFGEWLYEQGDEEYVSRGFETWKTYGSVIGD